MIVECASQTDCPIKWLRLPFHLGYLRWPGRFCLSRLWMSARKWEWIDRSIREAMRNDS